MGKLKLAHKPDHLCDIVGCDSDDAVVGVSEAGEVLDKQEEYKVCVPHAHQLHDEKIGDVPEELPYCAGYVGSETSCKWCGVPQEIHGPPRTTNRDLQSPRGLIADKEATCDPIFLFQYRRYVCSPAYDWEFNGLKLGDEGEVYDEGGEEVSEEELVSREILVETWVTERVFATREEGDAYGKRRGYDYPDGWRTYCVPCDGSLAELLVQKWGRG